MTRKRTERRWTVVRETKPTDRKRPWCVVRGTIYPLKGPGCRHYPEKKDAVAAATHSAERRGGLVCIAQSDTGAFKACCVALAMKRLQQGFTDEDLTEAEPNRDKAEANQVTPADPVCDCIRVKRIELAEP